MKKMICIAVYICFIYSTPITAIELELKITISKNEYLIVEPVEIGISLKNKGNTLIKTMYPHPTRGTLKIDILNSDGHVIPYTGVISCWDNTKKNLDLAPNEEAYLLLESDEFYGEPYSENSPNRFIEAGEYTLQAFFNDGDINVASNKIFIKVVYPTDKELIVYSEFIKIFDKLQLSSKQNATESCNALLSLVEKYPSSVYAPLILVKVSSLYQVILLDNDKAINIRKRIMDEYTRSGKSQNYLNKVVELIPQKSNQLEYLQKIKLKSKNSLMEKIIDKKISEIN